MIRFDTPAQAATVAGVEPAELDRILAEGATLPAAFYTDERIAAVEDDLVWRSSWQIVGVEPELREPGDYFTTHITGTDFSVPVVVVRDDDLQLRAFVNVCRHRAHHVAVGQGRRKTLQCTYHGWVYGLDGCLRGVPRSEEGGLPPYEQLGLLPLPLETWAGYIFVCIEERESLADALGELPDVFARQGFEFPFAPENADPEHAYVRQVSSAGTDANWKAQEENNVECYHCPTTHTHSFSDMYKVDSASYFHREFDRGVYHTGHFTDLIAGKLGIVDPDGTPDYQFYYLWPNMTLSGGRRARREAGFSRLFPDGVHACTTERVRYVLPGGDVSDDPELDAEFAERWQLTAEEDREAAARVQRGLNSGLYEWGYTLPESERNMRHFYGLVWKALAPAFR